MSQPTDVEVVTGGQVVLYDTNLWPDLQWKDPLDYGPEMGARFRNAKTAEDLFKALESTSTRDLVGHTVEILSVEWQAYQADNGVVPNGICQAADLSTGEVISFSTTSSMCTAFLRQAELAGILPIKVRIEGQQTRSGQTALNFKRP